MADDWIKVRKELHDDPAVIFIAARLRMNVDEVCYKLCRVWGWFDSHTTDGIALGVTGEWLDSTLVHRSGFAEAMASVPQKSWLEIRTESLSIPRFDNHNGETAKQRAQDTKRKRRVRKMSGKVPDNKRTRAGPEEKREENIEVASATSSVETAPAKNDLVWDAVAEIWFGAKVITRQKARVGAIVRDLKELGVSTDDIRDRHKRMRDEWGDKGATPESLVKHWHAFGPDRKVQGGSGSLFGSASPEAASPARIRAAPGKYANIKAINAETNGKDGG